MRRILAVALLALGGTFAMSGLASADIGDIQRLTVNETLFGSASEVDVSGTIDCQATLDFGLWVGVAQQANGFEGVETFNIDDTGSGPGADVSDHAEFAEAVGAYGPNFAPPAGVSDDSPCSQAVQPYDVVVQQNRDSGDFQGGAATGLEVFVQAGTSAENGNRGPGPFIGDTLGLEGWSKFERTR